MEKYIIGGGKTSLMRKEKWLSRNKKSYTYRSEGTNTFIDDGRKKYKYHIKSNADSSVMNCSKSVKRLCEQFEEDYGALESGEYKNRWMSESSFDSFLRGFFKNSKNKGKKPEISYVDVNHCYWQIAHIYGLLDDDTYEKYKDNRLARLTAIGCRQRSSYTDTYEYGRLVSRVVERNPLAWVWDFVNYQSFLAMESVRSSFAVFSYYTDGVYLPSRFSRSAQQLILSKHKLVSKIEHFDVIGYCGRYLVLYGKTSKRYKQTRMIISDTVKKYLKEVDYSLYKAKNELLDEKQAAKLRKSKK